MSFDKSIAFPTLYSMCWEVCVEAVEAAVIVGSILLLARRLLRRFVPAACFALSGFPVVLSTKIRHEKALIVFEVEPFITFRTCVLLTVLLAIGYFGPHFNRVDAISTT